MPCRAQLLSLLFLFFLLSSVRILGAESSPRLPAPKDVIIYSYNFHSLLRWSPVKVDRGLVLYTVHFKTGAFNQWDEMNCTRITQTECSFPWSLKERRWTVVLRVRAELGQVTSDWVETDPFVAERNTTIGPPKVNSVIASSDSLLISVAPPFGLEVGDVLQYHVSYWENTTSTTKKETTRNTLFKIKSLKELTLYCFRIQVELMTYSDRWLLGLQSVPQCSSTTMSEATRAGYIILVFLVVLLFLNLVTIGLFRLWRRHHKTIKYWSQPALQIPSHIEEKNHMLPSFTEGPEFSASKLEGAVLPIGDYRESSALPDTKYLKDPRVPGLEALDSHTEDDAHDSLPVLVSGEGSEACDSSLDDQACLHSISHTSDVT